MIQNTRPSLVEKIFFFVKNMTWTFSVIFLSASETVFNKLFLYQVGFNLIIIFCILGLIEQGEEEHGDTLHKWSKPGSEQFFV